jgi:hypothetical protein
MYSRIRDPVLFYPRIRDEKFRDPAKTKLKKALLVNTYIHKNYF